MAHAAVLRETRLHVIRIRRCRVLLRMASVAARRSSAELSAKMATCTVELRVHSGQREAGELEVIEFRPKPAVHRMAAIAGDRD